MRQLVEQMPRPLHDIIGPLDTIRVPAQGYTSNVVIAVSARGSFVVKRAKKPPYTEWLRREYEMLSTLNSHMRFVPKPLFYVEEYTHEGYSHWLLMEYIPGEPLRQVLRHIDDGAERRRLLFEFGRTLARIHNQEPPSALESGQPWLDHMLQLAAGYLRDYDVDGDAELLERLRVTRPEPLSPCLIHGDYTLDNVLIHEGQVSGVIDWCWGTVGDPRHDLAIATRQKPEAFTDAADLDAFYDGYAGRRLTADERDYFLGLYEFF